MLTCMPVCVLQVAELVTQVVPGCSLAELAALEAILAALAQQGILSVPALVQLLFQDMCHYFMKLQQADQAERERRRRSRRSGSSGATAGTAAAAQDHSDHGDAMDVDVAQAAAPAAAEASDGHAEGEVERGEIVDRLRHVFALLSMLASAQPGAIKAKHVPVLLEVAFSPHLAVRSSWQLSPAPTPLPLGHVCMNVKFAAQLLLQLC